MKKHCLEACALVLAIGLALPPFGVAATESGAPPPAASAHAAVAEPSCAERPAYHRLDFWLGDWNVYVGTVLDGTNRIERILDGCVVQESWHDATGYDGRSWFWVDPSSGKLRQVWLTTQAYRRGGVLEKDEVPSEAPGSVRMQRSVLSATGVPVLGRTTLTPLRDGTVRQVIESSKDGGSSWDVSYDAIYRRASPKVSRKPKPP